MRAMIARIVITCVIITHAVGQTVPVVSAGAQQTRYFNGTLTVMEAENFTYAAEENAARFGVEAAASTCRGLPWSSCAWGDGGNLFASDVSNVFMSRRAYLHADANATFGAKATAIVPIASTGPFNVMARYEAGYRFHSPFKVDVQQNGSTLFSKVFGLKTTPKVWGFQAMRETDWTQGCGPGLQPECRWIYSATENMVWEGTTAAYAVNLTAGLATITLTVVGVDGSSDEQDSLNGALTGDRFGVETTGGDLIAERNVDVILLHPNQTDIDFRMNTTLFPNADGDGLVFDGLVSQEGEVFVRVASKSDMPMAMGFPRTFNRSPLWEERTYFPQWVNTSGNIHISHGTSFPTPTPHQRVDKEGWIWSVADAGFCGVAAQITGIVAVGLNSTDIPDPTQVWKGQPECIVISVAPHATSDWVDVGRMLDTLDHSSLNLPVGNYTVEFGVKALDGSGKIEPLSNSVYDAQANPAACNGQVNNRTNPDESCWNAPSLTTVLIDSSIRATRRTRPITAEFFGIMDDLENRPAPHGKPPTEVMITADTFPPDWARGMYAEGQGYPDPKWQSKVKEFVKMFGLTRAGEAPTVNSTTNFGETNSWAVGNTTTNFAGLHQLVANGAGNKSWFTNLGDEISMGGPESDYPPATNQSFLNSLYDTWLKARGISPETAGCDPYDGCVYNTSILMASEGKGRAFYYSNMYRFHYEIYHSHLPYGALKGVPYYNITADLLAFQKQTGQLINGHTTANFPPSQMIFDPRNNQTRDNSYLPKTNMWVNAMRAKAFTLPFTEDYIFQIAAGSQQMYDLVIDVERAGIRPMPAAEELATLSGPSVVAAAPLRKLPETATVPGRPIMQYIMVHNPGNTVNSERRRFYASIAHGAKWINYFVLATFATGPGDFTDSHHGMYPAIRQQLNEYGTFDDIVAHGVPQAQGAKAAILFSTTADMYWDAFGTPGAAKRALYVTIRHAQIALDVVTEEDLESGLLNEYALLFVTDQHLRNTAATALQQWVHNGGTLFGSVGMGLLNEFNETNVDLAAFYGVAVPYAILGAGEAGPGSGEISFVKQDLQYVEPWDIVSVSSTSSSGLSPDRIQDSDDLLALGEKAVLHLHPAPSKSDIFASFKDGSPAMYRRAQGNGTAIATAFHLGLSYFRPALPKRPVDRGSTDENFNHFIPTAFAVSARQLIETATSHIQGLRPVVCEQEQRLDLMVIAAAGRGTVITVVNWSDKLFIPALKLELQFDCDFSTATLASGGAVQVGKSAEGRTKLTFDLGIADAVILRV